MNIVILSRNKDLYSTRRLVEEAEKRNHIVEVIDPLSCDLIIENEKPTILYKDKYLDYVDAIIPRIGASVTFYGCAVVRQFEMMNVFSSVSSDAIIRSRDKLRSFQHLSKAGVDMPKTVFTNYSFDVETLFQDLLKSEIIDVDHEPVFHALYDFNNKPMNEYNTSNSHKIVANQTYNGISNIYEETSTGEYRLHVCKNALHNMMRKSSINIRVPGIMYMTGTNASIGRQIDFIYPANNTNVTSQSSATDEDAIDKKRSGTYVIYTARHHFVDTQHNVDMSCVKLGNRKVRG
jgi:hypothetical protein